MSGLPNLFLLRWDFLASNFKLTHYEVHPDLGKIGMTSSCPDETIAPDGPIDLRGS